MKTLLPALIALSVVGCGPSEQSAPSATGAQSAKPPMASATQKSTATAATASAPASASAAPSGDQKGKMANCPAAAPNAKTEIKDVDKGVEVTVTAADKADVEEIKRRAKDIGERAKGESDKPQHTGEGGGGGVMGRCPIVLSGTDVKVADAEGGSKFTVTAKDEKEVDWLRRETKERLAAMKDTGEGKMTNCPSSVGGAKTTVKEAGGAIVVSIVAKDEAATKAIRERAKKVTEMKHDKAANDPHDGSGAGAGEGRCPAVLEGATAAVKDVDGGSEITLKPKNAADLKKLTQEAKDRAARFD